ncbi:aminoglycoside 3'-phosphotransferase [Paenibacillus sp. 32352]|uniref:aminoglycoside 3'-phosphotransferase n=1 Tax=Paenibacillus sp. 32352 TaxID=1969111 RepID=UPI0009AD9727|nr:aminoglycoside 3'-phosphotransferase [Paenibacillus sp. 32352]
MRKTITDFDKETVPASVRPLLDKAVIYDSSCSEEARTLLVEGTDRAFLKISKRGRLKREFEMTQYLHRCHGLAPNVMAYDFDEDHDYLVTQAVAGEDGTAEAHIANPMKLASVFGEYLRMLHSLSAEGCPYLHRTMEMLEETGSRLSPVIVQQIQSAAEDHVLIHGDYCLPNIIMDNFALKGFIDLGYGGVGDRHYDLYWGMWTLAYNLKTDRYMDAFLDAYGRQDVDEERLKLFTLWMDSVD